MTQYLGDIDIITGVSEQMVNCFPSQHQNSYASWELGVMPQHAKYDCGLRGLLPWTLRRIPSSSRRWAIPVWGKLPAAGATENRELHRLGVDFRVGNSEISCAYVGNWALIQKSLLYVSVSVLTRVIDVDFGRTMQSKTWWRLTWTWQSWIAHCTPYYIRTWAA